MRCLYGHRADGLLIVFVVDDIDREYMRIQSEGVPITTAIKTEPWGERFFQVTDPNGVVIQLVQWVTENTEELVVCQPKNALVRAGKRSSC
nr:VOC family protein [Nostoc sp. ChiSLP03a]